MNKKQQLWEAVCELEKAVDRAARQHVYDVHDIFASTGYTQTEASTLNMEARAKVYSLIEEL